MVPSLSLKFPEVTLVPDELNDPAAPAVLVLKGPCTPPFVPDDPPPPPNVTKALEL